MAEKHKALIAKLTNERNAIAAQLEEAKAEIAALSKPKPKKKAAAKVATTTRKRLDE